MIGLDALLRRVVVDGELVVHGSDGRTRRYGRPRPNRRPVAVRFASRRAERAVARNPALGAGEAFMDGGLEILEGDVLDLLDLVTFNLRWDRDNPTRRALWRHARIAALWDQWNWARRSKRNVAHHYDLDGRLYDLFLDADRQYSCAYFVDPGDSLERAQAAKKAHIAAKLALAPGQRVLDVGCGWGGLALHLHAVAGVDVLGVTLSEEQLAVARARAAAAGVADRVRFELVDYRAVEGRFDRIVSVGMLEHVGLPHYRAFFDKVADLLTPDGVALIHTIGRADGPGATDPWTAKYIFPGGYAPALSQLMPAIERSWLWATDIETLRLHYAYTLEEWYARAVAERDRIVRLYDERFHRMWLFYLAGAICAFRNDGHVNYQIQLARRRDALPITRDYMAEAERRYLSARVDVPPAGAFDGGPALAPAPVVLEAGAEAG
ncbi:MULTISPECIES: SAM-dependent methyltransferase [Sphingomonas]|uniref:SAM-dependent methyltransferase n=2 Tax=Sphingomonas TaxID=13687 RepID=A0A2A4I0K5_9SPHN|nr:MULTISPECIES: cyclopropane-fatty-acyl-phospholipid synthase family protein [Sphingomonas]NJC35360.1 cyclopropane-fatty-acyl-phospholipid synthase [Sphingomonas jejuensis]PCG09811.1 SAM-dependent methyltransferase [Sphingomonas ginsenosidimutans]